MKRVVTRRSAAFLMSFSLIASGAVGITGAALAEPGTAGGDGSSAPASGWQETEVCEDDTTTLNLGTGTMDWNVKDSFLNYIRGTIANGNVDTTEGATYVETETTKQISWPFTGDHLTDVDPDPDKLFVNGAGSVRFTGHTDPATNEHGLDSTLVNPQIKLDEDGVSRLYVSVKAKEMGGPMQDLGVVDFAVLEGQTTTIDTDNMTVSFEIPTVKITANGAKAFGGFYKEGLEISPISGSAPFTYAQTCTTVKEPTAVTPQEPVQSKADGKSTISIPAQDGVIYSIDGAVVTGDYEVPADATQVIVKAAADEENGWVLTEGSPTSWTYVIEKAEPEEPVPGDEETPAPGDGEEECTPDPNVMVANQGEGSMVWSVKDSFRDYINRNPDGKITASEGATWANNTATFPLKFAKYTMSDHKAKLVFDGSLNFVAHAGILNMTISNPMLMSVDGGAPGEMALYANVVSNDMTGKPVDYGQVRFANVITKVGQTNGMTTVDAEKITLAAEGVPAFGGFYQEGEELASFHAEAALRPKTCDSDPEPEQPAPDQPKPDQPKPEQPKPEQPKPEQPAPDQPAPGQPAPEQPAPGNDQAPAKGKGEKKCVVDPTTVRVTGGSMAWGVKTSFTTYVRGGIAKGGWDLAGGATWNGAAFNFPVSHGTYSSKTASGTINYAGSIHFTGHHGVLDVHMSNPTLKINGNKAQLWMTVDSSDMSGNKKNFGRIHFANVGISAVVSADGKSMRITTGSVTLTSVGAQAFAGFYSAGQAMDLISSNLTTDPSTSCTVIGPDGELVRTGASGMDLTSSMALVTMALGLSAVIISRRKQRQTY